MNEINELIEGVSYLRLSQESDTSIPSQREDIESYSNENNIDLISEFNDGQNSSGFNDDRPEYQSMKSFIREEDVDAVVVRDRQRIGRDFDERMRFILDLRELGVELHTTMESEIDLDDPYSVAVEGIHSASDDKKKRQEIEKGKAEIRKRQEKGYYQGGEPFGLEFDENGRFLVPSERFKTALLVIKMKDFGFSYVDVENMIGVNRSTAYRIVNRRKKYKEVQERDAV